MKLIYTEQALHSLSEAQEFIAPKVNYKKLMGIRDGLPDAADSLVLHQLQGTKETLKSLTSDKDSQHKNTSFQNYTPPADNTKYVNPEWEFDRL